MGGDNISPHFCEKCMQKIDELVNYGIELLKNNHNEESLKNLGVKAYVQEYRILSLRVPRQTGKSTYIRHNASILSDIILYPNHQMLKCHGLQFNVYDLNTLNLKEDYQVFNKQYSIIWLDEFESDVFKDPKYRVKINSLIHTGYEIIVHLTSM